MLSAELEQFIEKSIIIVGLGLIGYERLLSRPSHMYSPPTEEEVIEAYQNKPLFSQTVDTIISHLLRVFPKHNKET